MKPITGEWLTRANEDLRACSMLVEESELTNIAAFHAQQAVEKCLKAIAEEHDLSPLKAHDLERLYAVVDQYINLDENVLETLSTVYIQARYPADLGLMPGGRPTNEDALKFLEFAEQVYHKCQQLLLDRP